MSSPISSPSTVGARNSFRFNLAFRQRSQPICTHLSASTGKRTKVCAPLIRPHVSVGVHASACRAKRTQNLVAADVRRIGAPKRCGIMPSNLGENRGVPFLLIIRKCLSFNTLQKPFVGRLKLNEPEGFQATLAGGKRGATPGIAEKMIRTLKGCQNGAIATHSFLSRNHAIGAAGARNSFRRSVHFPQAFTRFPMSSGPDTISCSRTTRQNPRNPIGESTFLRNEFRAPSASFRLSPTPGSFQILPDTRCVASLNPGLPVLRNLRVQPFQTVCVIRVIRSQNL